MNDFFWYLTTSAEPVRTAQAVTLVVILSLLAAAWGKRKGRCISFLGLSLVPVLLLAGFSPREVEADQADPFFAAFLSTGFFREPTALADRSADPDRILFEQNCTLCHTAELVSRRTAGWDRSRIRSALDHLNRLNPAMPDYKGTGREKDRLADYIIRMNNGPQEPGGNAGEGK